MKNILKSIPFFRAIVSPVKGYMHRRKILKENHRYSLLIKEEKILFLTRTVLFQP